MGLCQTGIMKGQLTGLFSFPQCEVVSIVILIVFINWSLESCLSATPT